MVASEAGRMKLNCVGRAADIGCCFQEQPSSRSRAAAGQDAVPWACVPMLLLA